MNAKTQERGHCPCCGREQAVIDDHMSKHGYTVEHGWFQGICSGQQFAPIEHDREVADKVVIAVRSDVERLMARIAPLENGEVHPAEITEFCNSNSKLIPWDEAPGYRQRQVIEGLVSEMRFRARQGVIFADFLEKVIAEYHGKPLLVATLPEPPKPIRAGEKRKASSGLILTAKCQDRARVIYTFQREQGGKVFQAWLGTQAWRKLEKVS